LTPTLNNRSVQHSEAEDSKRPTAALHLCFVGWGDHVHVERWAGHFARSGHRVSVVSFTGTGRYPTGVIQRVIGMRHRAMRWQQLKLKYLLWKLKPDLVHAHWAHYAHPLMRAWGGPSVVTVYGSDIYRLHEQDETLQSETIDGLRRVDFITCDSKDMQQRIVALTGRSENDVETIQWGVDVDMFSPGKPMPEYLRSVVGHDRPVVFSARNFAPIYNQELVLTAFKQVLQEVPDALLIMKYHNGLPDYRRKIEADIAASDVGHAVRIVDSVPYEQMPDLYRAANVTISIPSSDATPMALLECMAAGSAPVFSDLPSLREWITDGRNGYLVEPSDHERLAERVVYLLKNPGVGREFAAENREIVRRRASQEVSMSTMEHIYRRLVHRTARV
jgi:glycosyltransferase involved in cell wall biosynthesis